MTYYDILGFGALVRDNKPAEEIYDILSIVRKLGDYTGPMARGLKFGIVGFSDTVVRSYGNPTPFLTVLLLEILNVALAQVTLLHLDVILRGCITSGDLCAKNGVVFGPALIMAHEMAEKVAVYPRVVIDPAVLRKARDESVFFPQPDNVPGILKQLKKALRKDTDGVYYVDYLGLYPHRSAMRHPGGRRAAVEQHRDLIMKYCGEHGSLDSVSSKYNWLAHYHNSTVSDLDDTYVKSWGCSKADLLVPLGEIKTTYDLGEGD